MRHEDFLMLKSKEVTQKNEDVQEEANSKTPVPQSGSRHNHEFSRVIYTAETRSGTIPLRLKPLPHRIIIFLDKWLCSLVSVPNMEIPATIEPFTFKQIARATENFDRRYMITEDSSCPVYKAVLKDGRVLAVKKRRWRSYEAPKEYTSELDTLARLKHERILSLIGFWCGGLLLVFDYTKLVSLDQVLFQKEKGLKLSWEIRHKICLQTAEALVYLHKSAEPSIVHCNIRASNILLDENFNVKISGFERAVTSNGAEKNVVRFRNFGHDWGYVAPECALRGEATEKTDVYSFGVLMIEVTTGRKNSAPKGNDEMEFLLDEVYVCNHQGNLLDLVDASLLNAGCDKQAFMMLRLGILCTNSSPAVRPSMSEVLSELEGRITIDNMYPS